MNKFQFAWGFLLGSVVWLQHCLAGYEVPLPAYNPPVNYYSSATGTGTTLKANLRTITAAMTSVSYGDARYALDDIYRDPNNASNVLLVYNRDSVSGTWDNGVTWSREHLWPQSLLNATVDNTYTGMASDLFELRPIDPTLNTQRSNKPYGQTTSTGNYINNSTWFYPSDADKGDVARAMFYMATRYSNGTTTPSASNLVLVNGLSPNTYEMGDLASLLVWHYTDGVDNYERRANQTIFDGVQGNRNPYIDHPEYVWAVFGTSANDSQLSVGTPAANGSSTLAVSLGRVMRNGTLGTTNVTLNKAGTTPTTFDIATSGNAITVASGGSLLAGTGQPMPYNAQTRTLTLGLNASTATTGLKSGTVTINNTDLTTLATGRGSADGDDVITVTASVVDKRAVTATATTINLGNVVTGATINTGYSLVTTLTDDQATRVNVAGSTAIDGNGLRINGTTALFNSASSTSPRSLTGTLTGSGPKSGTLSLPVTTAENSGAGLTGEGTYAAIPLNYTATVLAHADASFTAGLNTDVLTINFGTLTQNSEGGEAARAFNIANMVTVSGYTAGLDLTSISFVGSNLFDTNLASLLNLGAGNSQSFQAFLDTSTIGSFSGTYTFGVSDQQSLLGATPGTSLTLNLIGNVVAVPEPSLILAGVVCGGVWWLKRRRAAQAMDSLAV